MSYSLPFRALAALHRPSGAQLFQDAVHNILVSNIEIASKQRLMAQWASQTIPWSQVMAHWQDLASWDLSPTGLYWPQVSSHKGIAHIWHAYNQYSDVLDPSQYQGHRIQPVRKVSHVHARLLEMYLTFFQTTLGHNRPVPPATSFKQGHNLSEVARLLEASRLVRDACDYFMAFPKAKVANLYIELGINPRTAERRFAAEGLSAIKIKRASALSSASRHILWTEQSLADIATRFGYTDAAHLHHEFRRATGGIPPSVYRQAGRLAHAQTAQP